jgi:predicted Zn-dependent peptidase
MERNEHVRSVSAGVWVKVGSGLEKRSLNGVSHFLEHMVFKGTSKRSGLEIATVLESLGGDLNAFTDREVTCYHCTVLSEHIDIALDVLSDLTLNPTFPKGEIELEKKVLLQELSMVDESPDDQIYDLFFRNVWKEQALCQPVIGTRDTIESFNRNIAQKFYNQYYHPSNMVISVAGNIHPEHIIEKCEHLFLTQEKRKALPPVKQTVTYFPTHKKAVTPTDQLHLIVGFEGLSMHDSARFDALVLNFYLGGGMSSRLFQEIREKAGLAYTVDCDFIPFSDAGLCAIYLGLQPKSLSRCLSILGKEIQAVTSQTISPKALELVKSQIRGSIILSSEQTESRQESLGRNEVCFGRHITPEEIVREIDKVNVERVQEVAKRLFVPEKESTITLSRVKPKLKEVSIFS